jgi:ComF family protein
MRIARLVARLGRAGLDAVLPPLCLACGAIVDSPGALCPACWARTAWLGPPLCACCGAPFTLAPERADARCAACLAAPPPFARARAAFRYEGAGRELVLGFKHADRLHLALALGAWAARAGAELLAEADLVAPVPLHWTRLARRRFNQAALVARAAARLAGRPCVPDLLVRRRRTPPQTALGRLARARNVRGAFSVRRRHRARVAGKRIVLVADVFTTGATAAACARALLGAGAAAVDVLTLARVVRAEVAG